MPTMNVALSCATSLLFLLAVGARLDNNFDPVVTTRQGHVRGTIMTSRNGRIFYGFLGIPYAAPPVGELRFRAPEPAHPWSTVLNATQDGPMCMQKNYLIPKSQVEGQEDCLYLNVYTPDMRPKVPLEVMVHIHGGGFFSGTGASSFWGPQYLLDKDIVLVSFNYRLGVLGFLSTGDSAAPGNYGLKDQVEALTWVKQNIVAFGGNPKKVTIFGQSAGGASVHLHMFSPLSAGLFHRAISQSGTALNAWAWPTDSLSLARRQAMYAGCNPEDDTSHIVACLKKVDGKTLIDSGDRFKFWSVDPLDVFGPVVENGEGAFLKADPFYLMQTRQFYSVPWMAGFVTYEGNIRVAAILTNTTLLEDLNQHLPLLGPSLLEIGKSVENSNQMMYVWDRIVKFFLGNQTTVSLDKRSGFLNMFTDRSFLHGVHKSAQLHQRVDNQTMFLYHFAYNGIYSFTQVLTNTTIDFGVSHIDDLIYLFHLPLLGFPDWPAGHPDLQISELLVQLWTNFAKYGHPTPSRSGTIDGNPANDELWKPVSAGKHLPYLEIGAGPNLTMKQDWFKERMDFWDSLPLVENEDHLTGYQNFPKFNSRPHFFTRYNYY